VTNVIPYRATTHSPETLQTWLRAQSLLRRSQQHRCPRTKSTLMAIEYTYRASARSSSSLNPTFASFARLLSWQPNNYGPRMVALRFH
jgi:hypothetical protein